MTYPLRRLITWQGFPTASSRGAKVIANDRVDIVHCQGWYSGLAAIESSRAWSIPLVATIHQFERGSSSLPLNALARTMLVLQEYLVQNSNRIICYSKFMAKELEAAFPQHSGKLRVVPNGVNAQLCAPREITEAAKASPSISIVYVGRLEVRKGINVLVEAFRSLNQLSSEVTLRIVGTGPLESDLRKLTAKDSLIKILGRKTGEDLLEEYHRADIVVIPSTYEAFGLIALEAMAAGKPVVASATGGLKEIIVDGKTGMLVTPGEPSELATALERLIADPELRHTLGIEALDEANNWSWERTAHLTNIVYEKVMGSV